MTAIKQVRKAVIPAAGLGTRFLPATKATPKEMLPIVDKPTIQYIIEEALASGIEDILIITGRSKRAIEDHFDRSIELELNLAAGGKAQELEMVKKISDIRIHYIRQKEPRGLGHAILCAKQFIGDEPFAVLYGDDVIMGEYPTCKQLTDQYEKYGVGCVAMKEVPFEQVTRYSSLKVENLFDNVYKVTDMVEKPATPKQAFSNFSILGRCVLPPEIFGLLETLPTGAGGEYQLTDAMKILAQTQGMIGVDFVGTRYDMGNKLGIMQAAVETAINHPEIGENFKKYLKDFTKGL